MRLDNQTFTFSLARCGRAALGSEHPEFLQTSSLKAKRNWAVVFFQPCARKEPAASPPPQEPRANFEGPLVEEAGLQPGFSDGDTAWG